MATDWIKVRLNLHGCREVAVMSARLGVTRSAVLGACVTFWLWADGETESGVLEGCTPEIIDRIVELPGFSDAMMQPGVDWLRRNGQEEGLFIPNFTKHMGSSAKARSMASKRANERRERSRQ